MQLPIIEGVIYPTALPIVEGQETIDVTSEQHGIILADWSDGKAYTPEGSEKELTQKLKDAAQAALDKSPAMAKVYEAQKADEEAKEQRRKEALGSLGKKRAGSASNTGGA